MSTGTEHWTPHSAASAEAPVNRPAWMTARTSGESEAAAAVPSTNIPAPQTPLYCDHCWSPLSPAADECPDCGRILAEMRVEQEQQKTQDRKWRPPRAGKPAYRTPAMRKKKAVRHAAPAVELTVTAGVQDVKSLEAIQALERARPLIMVVAVGLLLGSVAVASFWFSIMTYH